jgi:hypothetical protein
MFLFLVRWSTSNNWVFDMCCCSMGLWLAMFNISSVLRWTSLGIWKDFTTMEWSKVVSTSLSLCRIWTISFISQCLFNWFWYTSLGRLLWYKICSGTTSAVTSHKRKCEEWRERSDHWTNSWGRSSSRFWTGSRTFARWLVYRRKTISIIIFVPLFSYGWGLRYVKRVLDEIND